MEAEIFTDRHSNEPICRAASDLLERPEAIDVTGNNEQNSPTSGTFD
jgi:hypothetical protein